MNEFSIERVIDAFREYLRQISDDSVFTDEYLYFVLTTARATIIKNYMDDNREFSPWLYQRFCVKLCPSTFIECNCEPFDFGCVVYRSEKPIPKPIWDNITSVLKVSELWGEDIPSIRETAYRYVKYRKYKNKMYYLIGDVRNEKYLFIMSNQTPPRYIKLEGIFEDPTQVLHSACQDEECPRPQGAAFNLDISRINDLFKLATELMGITLKMPEDKSNNSDSTILQQKI
jgi:hypothetical protein